MKQLITLLLLLVGVTLSAQEYTPALVGKAIFSQTGGGVGYWQVSGTFTDESGAYDGSTIQINDVLYFTDGGNGFFLPITQVTSLTPPSFVVRVSNVGVTLISGVPTTIGAIYHPSTNLNLPYYVSGISNPDQQTLINYLVYKIDSLAGVPEITNYIGTYDVSPAVPASGEAGETWRNSVGELYYSDGTSWYTDKEIKYSTTSLQGLSSGRYKIGVDTVGVDTIYIANNGTFRRFSTSSTTNLDEAYNNFGSNPAIVNVDGSQGQGDLRITASNMASILFDNTGAGTIEIRNNASPKILVTPSGLVGLNSITTNSGVEIGSSLAQALVSVTSPTWTVGNAVTYLFTSTSSQSITLPAPSSCPSRVYTLVNPANIDKTLSPYESLSGATSTTLPSNSALTVQSNGFQWIATSFTSSATVSTTDGMTIDFSLSGLNITAEVKTNSLDSTHVKLRGLALNDISPSGATTGQIVKFDGTNWIVGNDGGTTYYAGTGIYISNDTIYNTIVTFSGDVAGAYNNLQIQPNTVGPTELQATGVSAGTYPISANHVPIFVLDVDGRITSISESPITGLIHTIGNPSTLPDPQAASISNDTLYLHYADDVTPGILIASGDVSPAGATAQSGLQVDGLKGRVISNNVPSDGDCYIWDLGQNKWVPGPCGSGGSISIAATQIAFGSGTNTITGDANFVYDGGKVIVGSASASGNDALVIKRALSGTINGHAVRDESTLTSGVAQDGYGSFDAVPTINGPQTYDHVAGFQARPNYNGTGVLEEMRGFWALPTLSGTGTTQISSQFIVSEPSGSGPLQNNFGLYIGALTKGSVSNYGIYSPSTTRSLFGGQIELLQPSNNETGNAPNQGIMSIRILGSATKQFNWGFNSTSNYGWMQAAQWGVAYSPIVLNPNGGNVGVGTASPSARLQVVGSGATSGTYTAQFHNSTGTSNSLVLRDDGLIGVGTTSPEQKLDVSGGINMRYSSVNPNSANGWLFLGTANTILSNKSGGMLSLLPGYNSTLDKTGGEVVIQGRSDDSGAGFNSGITFVTGGTSTTSASKRVSIENNGDVQFYGLNGTGNRFAYFDFNGRIKRSTVDPSTLILGNGNANQVTYYTGTQSITSNSSFVYDGTKVGIGATPVSLDQNLNVKGGIQIQLQNITPSANGWLQFGAYSEVPTKATLNSGAGTGGSHIYGLGAVSSIINRSTRTLIIQGATDGLGEGISFVTGIDGLERFNIGQTGFVGVGGITGTRTVDINGELRIRDLSTTTATKMLAADAAGVVSSATLGSGLSLSGGVLSATGSNTDLTFSGTSSPVTLNSSTGTDVTFTAGTGVSLSATGTNITIDNTLKMREESFTATGGQTAFTIAYSTPAVSGTSVPLRVYRNGVRLFWVASGPTSTQFTYSGTTVTTSSNTAGDIITIEYLN